MQKPWKVLLFGSSIARKGLTWRPNSWMKQIISLQWFNLWISFICATPEIHLLFLVLASMVTSIHLMIALFISCYITAKQVSSRLEKHGHINIALNVRRYAYMKTCAWYSFPNLKIITQILFFFCPILRCLLLSFIVLWCLLPRWVDFFVFLWKPILQLSHEPDISWSI